MDGEATFGDWLRARRRARDLTREALAELVSCATPTLAKIEQGTRRPSRELATLLLNALQTPPGEREAALRLARGAAEATAAGPAERDDPPPALAGLPAAPSPLIGRAAELRLLREHLADPSRRVVTLVGPGGVGKTRLALAAAEGAPCCPDGAAWVDLGAVSDPEGVGLAIAEAVGCPLRGAEPLEARLARLLDGRRLLLVLDNLEHLLAAAPLLDAIVRRAPGVKLLGTSRERLGLAGEWVVALEGLAVPAERTAELERSDAALLFLTRARQASAAFAPGPEERGAIAAICRQLEGLPLALELAATWTPALSCVEIAGELEQSIALLDRASGAVPARHRGMGAVFAHSWALLAEDERRALAALSVFQAGFTREAAERVAGAPLATLAALVEKSLLRRAAGGKSRYLLHELVRQHAAARLAPAEAEALRARHAGYYSALLATSVPKLQSGLQLEALAALDAERANLRAAWAWAVARGDEQAMVRCAPGLLLMHELRGMLGEAAALFGGAAAGRRAARPAGADRALGVLCAWEGWARGRGGELPAAHALLAEAVALLEGDDELLAATGALGSLGLLLLQRGRYAEARAALERSLALVEPRGLGFFATLHAVFLVNVLVAEGELAQALAWGERAIAHGDASGSPRAQLLGRCGAALAASAAGDPTLAQGRARAALALAGAARDPFGLGLALLMLGVAARLQGQLDEARYLLSESAEACEAVGDRWNQGRALVQLAMAEQAAQSPEAARDALRAALRLTLERGVDGVATAAAVELAALAGAERPGQAEALLAELGARPEADYATRARAAALAARLAPAARDEGGAGWRLSPAAPRDDSLAALLARHPELFEAG